MRLEMARASHPMKGEALSGDACCALPRAGGWLLAVVDALGHGPGAAETAAAAMDAVKAAAEEPLEGLLKACHESLKKTRGVAMSLAVIDEALKSLTWTGVGNVEGLLLRGQGSQGRERLLLRGGVVGYQMPPPRLTTLPIQAGDALVFATDGLRREFCEDAQWRRQSPQELADAIMRGYDSRADDALVWVLRLVEM